jgi:DNA-binding NtrC family response regulator
MRLGAFHYMQKPISLEALLAEVQQALKHGKALRDLKALKTHLSSEQGLGKMLGDSAPMVELREIIRKVAGTDSTVLVTGETGTGKELVANALHYESNRAAGPLIKVNCAALSETLLESELFGHEKGAFTGAERQRAGRFERADGGTLFLDEISEMGIHLQAKLLRVLQGDQIERVGSDAPIDVDVRLVAATNRDPLSAVEEGKLRNDLYYRLNIIRIHVPALRERRDDIPGLVESFIAKYCAKYNKNIEGVSSDTLAWLYNFDWPGNVRELENSIERAVLLEQGDVIEEINPKAASTSGETQPSQAYQSATLNLGDVEKQTILNALEASNWNKTRASEMLGIYPSSLYKKMKRFGISQKRP